MIIAYLIPDPSGKRVAMSVTLLRGVLETIELVTSDGPMTYAYLCELAGSPVYWRAGVA